MGNEELKNTLSSFEYLERLTRDITEETPKAGELHFICPHCKSGTGKHKTGAFSLDKKTARFKCFACDITGDIFDLLDYIPTMPHFPDFQAKLNYLADYFLLKPIDYSRPAERTDEEQKKIFMDAQNQDQESDKIKSDEQSTTDLTKFFNEAQRNINLTDYPQKRGLSRQIIERFKIGYVAEWVYPHKTGVTPSPRLIIPTSKESYTARATDSNTTKILKVGKVHIFNISAFDDKTTPVFITEGEIDALSLLDLGFSAVALGGVTNLNKLINYIRVNSVKNPLILALDSDETGQETTKKAIKELETLEKAFSVLKLPFKDVNDILIADREKLKILATEAQNEARQKAEELENKELNDYLKQSNAFFIPEFRKTIAKNAENYSISTGFKNLDKEIGGFIAGLYIVGAISSLGKTAYIMQIADQIAKSGRDVLIISLEMSRNELMARSVSRETAIEAQSNIHFFDYNGLTAQEIANGAKYKGYDEKTIQLIDTGFIRYASYADKIFIIEGLGDIKTSHVAEMVERHKRIRNAAPVVIVDYLQILAPYNERSTDKQNTDKNVTELKRISRDYKTPVIAISSLNRANYNAPISMEAFKESGAIEYSSDVLIGLQFFGLNTFLDCSDINTLKRRIPRRIEGKILKNRQGRTGGTVYYNYYPQFNYYSEPDEKTVAEWIAEEQRLKEFKKKKK